MTRIVVSARQQTTCSGCGIYDSVKQAIQDVVAPQLQELKGDIAGLRGEIVGLRGETRQIEKRIEDGFTSIRSEMHVRFAALDEKFTQRLNINKRLEEAWRFASGWRRWKLA